MDFSRSRAGFSDMAWILYSGGRLSSPEVGREGTWTSDGDSMTLVHPRAPFVVHAGTVDPAGEDMEGTMAGEDGKRGRRHAHIQTPDP